jgi:hypothetical protein
VVCMYVLIRYLEYITQTLLTSAYFWLDNRECDCLKKLFTYIHIHRYHSRLIPEGVAETSQIFLRHPILPKRELRQILQTWQVVSPSPSSQSISGVNAINFLFAFYDIHGILWKKERGDILFCPGHHMRREIIYL